jgi:hypothetical protein
MKLSFTALLPLLLPVSGEKPVVLELVIVR